MVPIRWRARGRVVSWPDRPNGVPSYPAPPRPDRPVVCPGFGFDRFTLGLLVRASGEAFRRHVFDALEGTRKDCSPGEQSCWHPVLPKLAPPPSRAPQCNPPVVCPGLRLHRFPGHSLHEKGLQRKKKRRYTGQQPGTKSAFRPDGQLLILFLRRV